MEQPAGKEAIYIEIFESNYVSSGFGGRVEPWSVCSAQGSSGYDDDNCPDGEVNSSFALPDRDAFT